MLFYKHKNSLIPFAYVRTHVRTPHHVTSAMTSHPIPYSAYVRTILHTYARHSPAYARMTSFSSPITSLPTPDVGGGGGVILLLLSCFPFLYSFVFTNYVTVFVILNHYFVNMYIIPCKFI